MIAPMVPAVREQILSGDQAASHWVKEALKHPTLPCLNPVTDEMLVVCHIGFGSGDLNYVSASVPVTGKAGVA